jgi:hypothetical protein
VQVPGDDSVDRSGTIRWLVLRFGAVGGVGAEQVMETEPAWLWFSKQAASASC